MICYDINIVHLLLQDYNIHNSLKKEHISVSGEQI